MAEVAMVEAGHDLPVEHVANTGGARKSRFAVD